MRAHWFQHAPFEGLGSISEWLGERCAVVSATRFYAGERAPRIEDVDLLIVMGGPMSVNDEAALPWLVEEKRFTRAMIEADKPVLGVCLGAQMIASAFGARVFPNGEKEIGWLPIRRADAGDEAGCFGFPGETTVFHWHGETFDLPEGARLLASSAACVNQAFQLGRRAIGLQFHLETTPEAAREIVEGCAGELVAGPWIQPAEAMLAAPTGHYESINGLMRDILDYLTEGLQ